MSTRDQEIAAQMYGKTTPTREGEVPGHRRGAPLTYSFTVPEGFEHLQPDAELHDFFSGVARGLNLTNEQAQELLHIHLRLAHDPKGKGGVN